MVVEFVWWERTVDIDISPHTCYLLGRRLLLGVLMRSVLFLLWIATKELGSFLVHRPSLLGALFDKDGLCDGGRSCADCAEAELGVDGIILVILGEVV